MHLRWGSRCPELKSKSNGSKEGAQLLPEEKPDQSIEIIKGAGAAGRNGDQVDHNAER